MPRCIFIVTMNDSFAEVGKKNRGSGLPDFG
jgi:hypothetical protein